MTRTSKPMQASVLRARREASDRALAAYRAELVRLRDIEGWSWGQFADALGMTREGARTIVNAARRLTTDA